MKKSAKPKKLTYKQLAEIACQLESRVLWALKFMKCPGAGMMVTRQAAKFSDGIHWTKWFADGVEMLGRYKVDRELLGLSAADKNKILKRRKAELTEKCGACNAPIAKDATSCNACGATDFTT